MYRSKILNQINLDYLLKFVVHKLNSEMVKSEIMMLTERKKSDITDVDMTVGWKLQAAVKIIVGKRERES
jgi:hypothetical protein